MAGSAGRPTATRTRRDVARGLLAVPSREALAALPDLRRQLIDAGNPMSAAFWQSAEAILEKIAARTATVGDAQDWLEGGGARAAPVVGMRVLGDPAAPPP